MISCIMYLANYFLLAHERFLKDIKRISIIDSSFRFVLFYEVGVGETWNLTVAKRAN